MNKQKIFPFVSPREEFRQELRRGLRVAFDRQMKPRFCWGWLAFSGATASLLVVFVISSIYGRSSFLFSLDLLQDQGKEYVDKAELEIDSFDVIDRELDEVSLALSQDQDINAAIELQEL